MYGTDELTEEMKSKLAVATYKFEDFLMLGQSIADSVLQSRTCGWRAGQTCSLIYTSGTTGPPKAVMITNDNYTWTCRTMKNVLTKGYMDNSDIMISYLPLSHVAGKYGIPTGNQNSSSSNSKKLIHYTAQMLDMHMPMFEGYQIYFAQPDALKGSLAATLREVRPTTFFGVPRVWEKMCGTNQIVCDLVI